MAEQLPFDLGHRSAYAREDFFVSDCNRDVIAWIDRWPSWSSPLLVIFGAVGCGKSHVCQVLHDRVGQDAMVSSHHSVLIVDDADLVVAQGADGAEKLLHAINVHVEAGGQVLLTATKAPQYWPLELADLRSRLLAAPAVAFAPPDDALMNVVLNKLFSDRQIAVAPDVVQYIIFRVERSFAALRRLVDDIDRKTLAEKRAVTIPLVRDLMQGQATPE